MRHVGQNKKPHVYPIKDQRFDVYNCTGYMLVSKIN